MSSLLFYLLENRPPENFFFSDDFLMETTPLQAYKRNAPFMTLWHLLKYFFKKIVRQSLPVSSIVSPKDMFSPHFFFGDIGQ
jgi:hypothetical protein